VNNFLDDIKIKEDKENTEKTEKNFIDYYTPFVM
jgi:hypothetical protein